MLAETALKKNLMRYAQSSKSRAQTSTNMAQSFSFGCMRAGCLGSVNFTSLRKGAQQE